MKPVGHEDEPRGTQQAPGGRPQDDFGSQVVAREEGARAELGLTEPGDDLGHPIERVWMPGAVLGVAVERQVRQDDAEPRLQRVDDRLPLSVREPNRVKQGKRRPGTRLPVGNPGSVAMVVEPEPHQLGSVADRRAPGPAPRITRPWPPSPRTPRGAPRPTVP